MLFILISPALYLATVPLTMVSVACLGSSFVLLNSFLPLLVSNHSSIQTAPDPASVPLHPIPPTDDDDQDDDDDDQDALLQQDPLALPSPTANVSPALTLSNQISSKGVGIGYAAAVLVQVFSIGILVLYSKLSPPGSSTTMPMRTVLFIVGLWWASFTVPTALWLRPRPGPPLPSPAARSGRRSCLRYIAFGWRSLWKTVRTAWRLKQVVRFLIGWFLLSDAIATISGTAILFARTELHMATAEVAVLSIISTAAGILGAFSWPVIGRRFNMGSVSIVLTCVCIYEFIPLYGLVGFIPLFQHLGYGGIQQAWEIYPLGFLLGFVMGGISSYCRSIFGSLVPPGMEAAFYTLYAVTDKGSSVVGPAVVGRIVDLTGSIRMAFWFLSVLVVSPIPFFWFVDVELGRREAVMMTKRTRTGRNGQL
jgi:UMF1 family MFS transporter